MRGSNQTRTASTTHQTCRRLPWTASEFVSKLRAGTSTLSPGTHGAYHETISFRCAPSASPLPQILFVYNTIDDFVMNNLKTYAGRPIKSAEAEDIELGGDDDAAKDSDEEEDGTAAAGLRSEDAEDLCSWLKESALPERVRCRVILLLGPPRSCVVAFSGLGFDNNPSVGYGLMVVAGLLGASSEKVPRCS